MIDLVFHGCIKQAFDQPKSSTDSTWTNQNQARTVHAQRRGATLRPALERMLAQERAKLPLKKDHMNYPTSNR